MKDSEIYLLAAKLIHSGGGYSRSCWAVNMVQGLRRSNRSAAGARVKYEKAILGETCSQELFESIGMNECDGVEQNQIRVLALLFMHQIAKDKERNG